MAEFYLNYVEYLNKLYKDCKYRVLSRPSGAGGAGVSSASPKFFVGVPFFRRALEMPFLKEVTKIKQIKIKHNTLLLIKFYRVENIKSITIFNSIVNALGRMDIPLTDCKVRFYDGQGLI